MLDSAKNIYKILDYASALDVVQSLEAKDNKNKGIVRLFFSIASWSEKYITNKLLPNVLVLAKDAVLEESRVESFLVDLAFRSLIPIVKKITTVEFDPSSGSKIEYLHKILVRNTVFLRPPAIDGDSCERILNMCNEVSVNAIKKGISISRTSHSGEKFKQYIFSKVNENKLSETYASWDISQLFNCKYDTTKNMKEETFNIHLKPILKMLSQDKVLLFFRNEKAPKISNKSIFLYNDPEEIIERKNIYYDFILETIIPNFIKIGILSPPTEEQLSKPKVVAETVLKFMDGNFGDQKTLVEELIILENHLEHYKQEMVQKELGEKVQEIIKYLESAGKICKVKNLRLNEEALPKEVVNSLISNSNLCFVEQEDNGVYHQYLLHKTALKEAIYLAKRLFEETGNDFEIRILSRMHIVVFVDDIQKRSFIEVEQYSYFKYLNFFIRIWRSFTGNVHVSELEAEKLKLKYEVNQKKKIDILKAKEIDEETARRVEEKLKSSKADDSNVTTPSAKKIKKDPKEEEKLKSTYKKIASILDSAWDREIYPDREFLVSSYDEPITEEELIEILKKNFSKEILSFQIKTAQNPPKYKWPILVTREYLKKNSSTLLEKAKSEHDKEKKSSVPNQDRFDLYSSLEEFLERIINKI